MASSKAASSASLRAWRRAASRLAMPTALAPVTSCAMGADGTLGSATAHMNASLPTLLAVVMRSKTYFGDFDAVQRDEDAIQSKSTNMLWTREKPLLVKVASTNDDDGKPVAVAFTVSDEAAVHAQGAAAVSNVPKASQ